MEEKTLNSKESLELITSMIAATRGKLERGGGTQFLIWGYTSIAVAVAVLAAKHYSDNNAWLWLWWGIPIVGNILMYFNLRKRPKQVKTYIDKFVGYIWLTIASVAIVFPIVGMFSAVANVVILPFEALILSIGVVLTGMTIKSRVLVVCGYISVLLSMLFYFISDGYIYIFIAMFVVGMVIPGHILNYKGRCLKS